MPRWDAATLPMPVGRQGYLRGVAAAALVVSDLCALAVSLTLAVLIRIHILPVLLPVFPPGVPPSMVEKLSWVPIIAVLCLAYEGLYTRRLPFWREVKRLVKALTLAFLLVLAAVSLGKMSGEFSRTVLVLGYAGGLFLLPLGRLAAKGVLARLGLWALPVLILAAGKTGELVAQALLRDKYLGYRIAGFLDDDPAKGARGVQVNGTRLPVLGGFRDSDRVMVQTGVCHLIVAAPGMDPKALVGLINRLQRSAASVTVIPDLFGVPVMGVETDYFFDEQALSLRIKNNLASPWNMFIKRAFDLAVGTIILLLALPLMAAIALAIKIDSPGPVIFAHRRIGRGGREFKCYKFRTMVVNAEAVLQEMLRKDPALRAEWERDFKLKNDPRITRVGRFLRRTSLDELPQIFNVLKGEMSLVGPRPIVRKEILRFGPYIDDFYLVRPGITGLWQVSGRNDIDYPERVRLESWYVRNWSLWLDITLLIRTVGVVLARRGAY
nr:undecaprenyl-phosphate galactose phosphotransferase WbaP [Desulfofundulus thermobenzoicus]